MKPGVTFPETQPKPVVNTLHGVSIEDPYQWLEEEKSPEVQAWMDAQDAFTRNKLQQLPLRTNIQERLRELLYIEVYSTPAERKGNLFYTHRTPTQEKSIYKMRTGAGEERTVLDPHTLSEDLSTSVGVFSPSPDGTKVAYSLKEDNADEAVLYVMDLATGESSDRIDGAKYAWPSWLPDGSGFYYTYLPTDPSIPTAERPGYADVRLHILGTPASEDPVIHPNTGSPQTFIGPSVSRDGR